MQYTILNTLPWLLVTFTFSESLTLNVSGSITAGCGQPVTLNCKVSSSLSALSIKHMEWSQSQTYCSVDNEGHLSTHNSAGEFHCHYKEASLSLHIHNWLPQQTESPFMCKVRSNQGIRHDYTRVKMREHWEGVEATWTSDFPTCTFRQVCPGGEVDWFQNSRKITNQSLIITKNLTEAGGLFTIYSYLRIQRQNKVYSCKLRSAMSGQYLTSALIHSPYIRSRAVAHGHLWICVGPLFVFIFYTFFN